MTMLQRSAFFLSVFARIFALRIATIKLGTIIRNRYDRFRRERAAIDLKNIARPKRRRQIKVVAGGKQGKIVFQQKLPSVSFTEFFIVKITQIFIKTRIFTDKRQLAHFSKSKRFFAFGQPLFKRIPNIFSPPSSKVSFRYF